MDKTTKEMLEEALTTGFEKLETLEPGSEAYNTLVNNLTKLHDQLMTEEKLESEENTKAMDRGLESEKMNHELEMKKEESRQNWLKLGGDLLKTGVFVVANGLWMRRIMKFEETGTITSKAFQFLGKPKIF